MPTPATRTRRTGITPIVDREGNSAYLGAGLMPLYGSKSKGIRSLSRITSASYKTKSLIHVNVPRAFRDEVLYNQDIWSTALGLRPAEPLLLVSGAQHDAEEVDVMALLAALRADVGPMNTLHAMGLSKTLINKLLSLEMGEQFPVEEYGLDIRDSAVTWVNDLETDERYRRWPASYMELLRPTYPGMLRNLRRNIYNYVSDRNRPDLLRLGPSAKTRRDSPKACDPGASGVGAGAGSRAGGREAALEAAVRAAFNYIAQERNSNKEAFYFLTQHATPVRVGLVLAPAAGRQGREAALEAAVRAAFNYIAQERNSNKEAFYFLTQLLDNTESKSAEKLSLEQIKKHLKKYAGAGADLDDLIAEDSEFNFGQQLAEEFVDKIGNNKFPEVLINGVPLADDAGNPTASVEQLEEALVTSLARHTARLQRAVFRGALSDADSPVDYLMKQPHIVPRLNRRVLGSESSQYLDLSGAPASVELFTEDKIHKLMHLTGRDALATALPLLRYFTKGTKIEKISQTIWIIGDLNNKHSRTLLKDALTYMRESTGIRVAFIPNVDGSSSVDQSLNKVVLAAVTALPPPRAAQYVAGLLDDEGCHEKQTCDILPELVPHLHKYEWVLKAARVLCSRSLHLRASARAVVHNARMIGPLAESDKFVLDDFALLERFTSQTYGDKLSEVFDKKKSKTNEVTDDDDDEEDDFIDLSPDARLKVISVVAGRGAHSRTPLPAGLRTEHSLVDLPPLYPDEAAIEVISVAGRGAHSRTPLPAGLRTEHSLVDLPPLYPDEADIEMVAVLDPASAAAQRLAPLLLVLRKVVNCRVKLFLNPQDKNSDMPLKSFYRYVLEPELQFTPSGSQTGGALARFARLPHAPLLSMELRTPPNWLVECVKSVYDLDNIRLADVDTVVHSEFELEYLLLEGHAWDTTLGTPPRGLQLVLGTRETPDLMDTIVMANLGYFQLKANPGAWILRLRPGRSEEIYEIVGHENTDTPAGSADIQVLMHSFRSHVIKLRVSKKADKQHLDLLADGDEKSSGGIWNSIASSFSGAEETDSEDTINVFSVASGHLYERFLRIMMVSVLKHTKSPVKFWFLKNYLSPSLKESLPYMAKEYGFSYELVQYQWPRWLQRQKDRQRTIWGYKILFLDVLFPLHVKKIIFVDADQIVRADLKELVDLDLGGAPYGYTPFCDSRKEMEGFRFWKQGYWRNHLQGRSYHISALYVVDLRRFRRVAAGDRLRGQYQALSQDPNSLSNLGRSYHISALYVVDLRRFRRVAAGDRLRGQYQALSQDPNSLSNLGRSYHISALYVVDLRRFRRVAAGDRLRGQYQALSQDPNSLSNLDQDLPNNMIHQVAIKSLPQEWLWCETWCDEKSKTYAKTIDLCNNPQTKEAKLSAAMRIVPEWTQYDEEIKALMARVRRGLFHAGDVDQESEIHHEEHDTSPSHDTHTEL
ncbi:unnamed protein product [Plutella xylostella]|uniref:(diamondback moth) hypothetical protein n=1 Tax=Plutella xylostella TaxID=51655 RepID=A0A8S4DY95_PLUXY|nr:unnamed protein product [Plutella xylostella]